MKVIKSNKALKKIKLSDILIIRNGFAFKNPNLKSGVKWLTIKNIKNGKIDWSSISYLPESYLKEYSDFILSENDLVMSLTRPITNDLLKVSKIDSFSSNSLLNQRNAKLIAKENCCPLFLYYLCLSYKMKNEVSKAVQGSDPPNISSKQIEDFVFDIPETKREQNKVAKVLSQQEEQVNNVKSLIERLEKRNQYYAGRLLSGELRVHEGSDGQVEFYENTEWQNGKINGRINKSPSDWNIVKLKDVLTGKSGFTPSTKVDEYYNGNIPWINISDMTKGNKYITPKKTISETVPNLKKKLLEKNSLLFSFKLSIGEVGYTKEDGMCTNEAIIGFEPSKNQDLDYFYHIIKKYVPQNSGENAYGAKLMNLEKINNAELLITNDFIERKLITFILKELDDEYIKAEQLLKKEQKRFDWMSDALLSGEYQIVG